MAFAIIIIIIIIKNQKTSKNVLNVVLISLLIKFTRIYTLFWCYYCGLWTGKCPLRCETIPETFIKVSWKFSVKLIVQTNTTWHNIVRLVFDPWMMTIYSIWNSRWQIPDEQCYVMLYWFALFIVLPRWFPRTVTS